MSIRITNCEFFGQFILQANRPKSNAQPLLIIFYSFIFLITKLSSFSRKPESHLPDHEMFAISLETLLSTHFMYGDPDFASRCVPSARSSILLGETIDDFRRHKKYSGYVVYVAYRLEPRSSISHAMKLSRVRIT